MKIIFGAIATAVALVAVNAASAQAPSPTPDEMRDALCSLGWVAVEETPTLRSGCAPFADAGYRVTPADVASRGVSADDQIFLDRHNRYYGVDPGDSYWPGGLNPPGNSGVCTAYESFDTSQPFTLVNESTDLALTYMGGTGITFDELRSEMGCTDVTARISREDGSLFVTDR